MPAHRVSPAFRSLFARPGLALIALLISGCIGSGGTRPGESLRVETAVEPRALIVHPIYQAAFDAVRSALEDEDTRVASATLARLRMRLESDLGASPTMKAAMQGGDDLGAQVLAGERPSRESVEAGLRVAEGFERVIDGRLRMEALDVGLELARREDGRTVDVILTANSTWPFPLTLRPGPGTLRVRRTSIEPRTGDIAVAASELALDELVVFEVPAGETARLALAEVEIEVPVGAIATEMLASISFNGGLVEEGRTTYPARETSARPASRTDYPGWLPLGYVDPGLLVDLVRRGDAPLALILEHTVRIAPARRDEALDRLGVAAETLPPQALRPVVPSLRWLSGSTGLDLDDRGWKLWLAERLARRRAEGVALQ